MVVSAHHPSLGKGVSIEAPWSAHVIVREVIVTAEVEGWTFYGVRAETRDDEPWDWPSTECLLWILDDHAGLRMWQDSSQPPRFTSSELAHEVESIIGHCELSSGKCYLAVKWKDRLSPTWELEQDMTCCADAVTRYFMEERYDFE